MANQLNQALEKALLARAEVLEETVNRLLGALSTKRADHRRILELFGKYPDELRSALEYEVQNSVDDDALYQILSGFLRGTVAVAGFVDLHLSHGTRPELSHALLEQLREELQGLSVSDYGVVLSHGKVDNFLTTYGDVSRVVYRYGGKTVPPEKFALFQVPRIEGNGIVWSPILLGHEVAHIAVAEHSLLDQYDLRQKFDFSSAGTFHNPQARGTNDSRQIARGLYQIAMSWATELLCDFYALSRFGPSAVCALAEYFTVIGAMDDLNTTHPPGNLRIKLLLDSLGIVIDSRLSGTLAPWVDVLSRTTPRSEAWADYLSALFSSHVADLESVSHGMGTGAYPFAERVAAIGEIADRLHAGVPGTDVIQLADASSARPVDSDVINAAWIARREDAKTPYDKLGKKAIDSITFIDRWHKRGATRPNGLDASGNPAGIPPASGGALSAADLLGRLQRTDEHAIVATPLVHLPRGAGLDLRVGRHFIAFRRSSTSAFDPLNRKQDPRSMQIAYEMAWDEKYMLHPGELVLGATLEYLVIPADLTAQVLTRSSYGRLGLLSATAVQVHPNLHGCLTLNS